MSDMVDYLKEKIAQVRLARFIGEVVWGLGSCISVMGLLLNVFSLVITGFSLLFIGLYLSVHYELRRLDYTHALEKFSRKGK